MADGDQPAAQPTEAEKRQRQRRELILAYKRAFTTESGQVVLQDLLACFGFDFSGIEKDDYTPGMDALGLARRDGCKSPIRYILRMRNVELKPLGQEKREGKAKSGLASRR